MKNRLLCAALLAAAVSMLFPLAGCSFLSAPSSNAEATSSGTVPPRLKCITEEDIRRVKAVDNRVALRRETLNLYDRCSHELFSERIPESVSGMLIEDEKMLIFATVLSHLSAPYGPSTDTNLFALLQAQTLHCGAYALLAGELFRNTTDSCNGELIYLGLYGGAVGNHAQVIFKREKRSLLLDPTVGLVAFTTFDQLLQGKPVKEEQMFSFFAQGWQLTEYNKIVKNAVHRGLYLPSDLSYYYVGVDRFKDLLVSMYTTTNPRKLTASFPTPGIAASTNDLSAYFLSAKEFRDIQSLENLCVAVRKDNYIAGQYSCSASNDDGYRILERFNRLLQSGGFYEQWKNVHPDGKLSDQGLQLVAETKDYRHRNSKYLTPEQSENVILLNRLILEETYPGLCPKHRLMI